MTVGGIGEISECANGRIGEGIRRIAARKSGFCGCWSADESHGAVMICPRVHTCSARGDRSHKERADNGQENQASRLNVKNAVTFTAGRSG